MPGAWHNEWQSHFCKKEVTITNKNFCTPSKTRRADVLLNKYIIEFQHSEPKNRREIQSRQIDWKHENKEIIWIIDGNFSCNITPISDKRYIIEYMFLHWKFKDFLTYDKIYLDINEQIYEIRPKFVKSVMIEVDAPVNKNTFINALKKEQLDIFNRTIKTRTKIYIKQQGAGNGKTWGIIQLLIHKDFDKYENFIYLTKQHSAVNVIKNELDKQMKYGELPNIKIISEKLDRKKYIIKLINTQTNTETKIIIGTMDSFMWCLGNKNIEGIDKFKKMVEDILDNDIRCSDNGDIIYTSGGSTLNLKTLLIGDEMQDLHHQYTQSLIKISRDKFVDFYAVGDKLQSITNKDNAFTYLFTDFQEDIIEVIGKENKTNECRRFTDEKLVNFVNYMIPFNKYELPEISSYKYDISKNDSLILFSGETIKSDGIDEEKIKTEVDKIMDLYKKEVEEYNRIPKDFLFVTPFVKNNPLLDEVNTRIRDYWKDKFESKEYEKYSMFHKSEEGTSIDLRQSENSTRIVSIHSAKGDGRPVVFVIGLTESALQKFSNDNDNLIFYSLLHVALTRQKEKLYIRYEANGDKIHELIENYNDKNDNKLIKPYMDKSKNIKLTKLIKHNIDENFDIIYKNLMNNINLNILNENSYCENMLIDLQHHNIRYSCFNILIILQILSISINNRINYAEQPIYQILKKLSEIKIINVNTKEYYKYLRNYKQDIRSKKRFPCLEYTTGKYKEYFKKFTRLLTDVKKNIKEFINSGEIKFEWLECICLYYMIEIYDNGQFNNFSINDLYDIIDISMKTTEDHNQNYINEHHKKIKLSGKICNSMIIKYPNMKYLLNHKISYNGENSHYNIFKHFNIIAYDTTNVLIINIKPQFTSINYNDVILESVFNTFIVTNVKIKNQEGNISEDYSRFNDKKIISCVLTFDNNYDPYYINWENCIIDSNKIIINMIKQNMITYFKQEHNKIYKYIMYCKQEKLTIKQISNEYSKLDKYCYKYVDNIFNEIKKNEKKNKNIDKYFNKEYFIEQLNDELEESIEDYLT